MKNEILEIISGLHRSLESIDENQSGYTHNQGWNAAILHVMDVVKVNLPQTAPLTAPIAITEAMIDAAARHLRETMQAGKKLTPWETTIKATKKKWLVLAEGTLRAAISSHSGE